MADMPWKEGDLVRKRRWIFGLAILCVLLGMTGYAAVSGGISLSRRAALFAAAPLQRLFVQGEERIRAHWQVAAQNAALRQENEELRQRLSDTRARMRESELLWEENDALRELLDLSRKNPDHQFLSARVIGRANGRLLLDQGSENGVAAGNAVMVWEGMAGCVTAVGAYWCEAAPMTDPTFRAGAMVSATGEMGIAQGGEGLWLTQLPQDSRCCIGGRVVTSGLGGKFPPNLLLGHIRRRETTENGLSVTAELRPAVDTEDLRRVLIITSYGRET